LFVYLVTNPRFLKLLKFEVPKVKIINKARLPAVLAPARRARALSRQAGEA